MSFSLEIRRSLWQLRFCHRSDLQRMADTQATTDYSMSHPAPNKVAGIANRRWRCPVPAMRRFTSRVGGGSAFFVRRHRTINMILECKHCEAVVNAEVLFSYDDRYPNDPPAKWTLAKCPSCNFPMLAVQEDYGTGWEETATRVYPPRAKQLGWSIPTPIRNAYREALLCFKSKAFTASAIMCRKALEGLCVEHGIKARNLLQSLKELKDKGHIEGGAVVQSGREALPELWQ